MDSEIINENNTIDSETSETSETKKDIEDSLTNIQNHLIYN